MLDLTESRYYKGLKASNTDRHEKLINSETKEEFSRDMNEMIESLYEIINLFDIETVAITNPKLLCKLGMVKTLATILTDTMKNGDV